jgi:hypothetical protein
MKHYLRLLATVPAAMLVLMAVPGRAENPKLALTVSEATAREALAKLSQASGLPAQIYQTPTPAGVAPAELPGLDLRSTFNWQGVTFAEALRQLCRKYHLRPGRRTEGYVLYPGQDAPAPRDPKPVGLVDKNGVRLSVASVGMYENRQINFGGGGDFAAANLQVQVQAQLGELDAEAIGAIENVTAKDDLGNVIAQQGAPYYGSVQSDGMYPDEWRHTISLPAPHPKARKLAWLEGDLVVFRRVQPARITVELPLAESIVRRDAGGITVQVSRFREQAEPVDEEDALPGRAQIMGPTVRTRVFSPINGGPKARWGYGLHPLLVGRSGRRYPASQVPGSGGTGSDGQTLITQATWTFPNATEKPAQLVWDIVERADPTKLFTFRMTDIPLPRPLEFNAKAVAPQPAAAVAPAEDRPFFEAGGARLTTRVTLGSRPAGDGLLDLGLSAKMGADWGPIRWMQVPVLDGAARLEDIKPGMYRLVRRFRPKDTVPAGGKWVNGEVQITLTAGKEAIPAALQWLAASGPSGGSPTARTPAGKGKSN